MTFVVTHFLTDTAALASNDEDQEKGNPVSQCKTVIPRLMHG